MARSGRLIVVVLALSVFGIGAFFFSLIPKSALPQEPIDHSVPCDWYYKQRTLYETSGVPYPADYPRCAPIKLTADHKIVYTSNLKCQYTVDFLFRYRVETWGELKHTAGIEEFSIQAPPMGHIAVEMTGRPNMYQETYEILDVGCTVKYYEECTKVREKRQFGIDHVYETMPIDKFQVFHFEINFPPDTTLGTDISNIFFAPHFIEFMPPGHPNHLAIMGPFEELDLFNSGDFMLLPDRLVDALVVGSYSDVVNWSEKGTFSGGDGTEEVQSSLMFTIEFLETPDIY
jgi:hypothetical protein